MGTIREDVFLGTMEKYNQKLEMLAKMAQPEMWTYKRIQESDPYRILRNYIQFTYNRLDEENKYLTTSAPTLSATWSASKEFPPLLWNSPPCSSLTYW